MKVKFVGFGGYMEVPCYEDESTTKNMKQKKIMKQTMVVMMEKYMSCFI